MSITFSEELIVATEKSAGHELHSLEDFTLYEGDRHLFKTGVFIENMPSDMCMFIKPKSGLAFKHGIDVMAGVIDADYRGDIGVILINHGMEPVDIKKGQAIAQGIVIRCYHADNAIVNGVSRGEGGYGSTEKAVQILRHKPEPRTYKLTLYKDFLFEYFDLLADPKLAKQGTDIIREFKVGRKDELLEPEHLPSLIKMDSYDLLMEDKLKWARFEEIFKPKSDLPETEYDKYVEKREEIFIGNNIETQDNSGRLKEMLYNKSKARRVRDTDDLIKLAKKEQEAYDADLAELQNISMSHEQFISMKNRGKPLD